MKKNDLKDTTIAAYSAYCIDLVPTDDPNVFESILERKFIGPELKDKFLERFKNTKLPTKAELEEFLNNNK